VPGKLIVSGDAVATAERIRAAESGFIPRVLGALLLVAGSAYAVNALLTLLVPGVAQSISQVALLLETGELPIVFWLLIRGARVPTRT
jgi:hypothetical protein